MAAVRSHHHQIVADDVVHQVADEEGGGEGVPGQHSAVAVGVNGDVQIHEGGSADGVACLVVAVHRSLSGDLNRNLAQVIALNAALEAGQIVHILQLGGDARLIVGAEVHVLQQGGGFAVGLSQAALQQVHGPVLNGHRHKHIGDHRPFRLAGREHLLQHMVHQGRGGIGGFLDIKDPVPRHMLLILGHVDKPLVLQIAVVIQLHHGPHGQLPLPGHKAGHAVVLHCAVPGHRRLFLHHTAGDLIPLQQAGGGEQQLDRAADGAGMGGVLGGMDDEIVVLLDLPDGEVPLPVDPQGVRVGHVADQVVPGIVLQDQVDEAGPQAPVLAGGAHRHRQQVEHIPGQSLHHVVEGSAVGEALAPILPGEDHPEGGKVLPPHLTVIKAEQKGRQGVPVPDPPAVSVPEAVQQAGPVGLPHILHTGGFRGEGALVEMIVLEALTEQLHHLLHMTVSQHPGRHVTLPQPHIFSAVPWGGRPAWPAAGRGPPYPLPG